MSLPPTSWQNLQQAADRARQGAAHEQAIELYTQALAQAEIPWEASQAMVAARADSRQMLGDTAGLDADLTALAEQAARRGDDAVRAEALARLVRELVVLGDLERAQQLAGQALQAAECSGQTGLLVKALCVKSLGHARKLEWEAAEACLSRAQAIASPADPAQQMDLCQATFNVAWQAGQNADARKAAEQGLRLARADGNRYLEGNFLNNLSLATTDLALSGAYMEQARQAYGMAGARPNQNSVLGNSGVWWLQLGLYERSAEASRQALLAARAMHQPTHTMLWLGNLALALAELGDFSEAASCLEEALAIAQQTNVILIEYYTCSYGAQLALYQGDPDSACRWLQRVENQMEKLPTSAQSTLLALKAVTMRVSGEREPPLAGEAAANLAQQALGRITPEQFGNPDSPVEQVAWWCYRALASGEPHAPADGISRDQWRALDLGRQALLVPIADCSDAGLRRGYLHRDRFRRLLIREWLQHAPTHGVSADEMEAFKAEVQRSGRLDDVFRRLLAVGVRLNAERDPARLPGEIVEEVAELIGAERIALLLLTPDGSRRLAQTLLPRPPFLTMSGSAEPKPDEAAFLAEIETWVEEASISRQGFVRQVNPQGALADQRSLLVAPLVSQGRLVGVIYCDLTGCFGRFEPEDLDLLGVLANQSAVAVENADWSAMLENKVAERTADLAQRTAELTIINRVQEGLVKQLDFQAIIDLVGDEIMRVFPLPQEKAYLYSVFIALYDAQTNIIQFPYWVSGAGEHLNVPPVELGPDLTSTVIQSRQALVLKSWEDSQSFGAIVVDDGLPDEFAQSWLGVPILTGERVTGVICVQDPRVNLYTDSDVRLLTTLAAGLGTALENARLFAETQHLFAETQRLLQGEQGRAAELQIINSIQQGLAAELEIQAIIDLVGDTLRGVFFSPNLIIKWYEEATNLVHYPYFYEHGERLDITPEPPTPNSLFAKLAETRQPVHWNTMEEIDAIAPPIPGTDDSHSGISVPIIGSDRVLGSITIENFEQEYAYGESELRLLSTVAASMGTALENARLFQETQRLLQETEQRASELAIINRISQAMSRQLDVGAIIQIVGDQVRDSFHAEVVNIYLYDRDNSLIHLPYSYDRQYVSTPPFPYGSGLTSKVIDTRQPLILGSFEEIVGGGAILTQNAPDDELMPQSYLGVPIIVGEKAIGVIDVQSYQRFSYDDSHVRLLSTLASSMGVALENARLFAEIRRLLAETEQRNRELAAISRVGQALVGQLDPQGIYELAGEELRQIFDAQVITIITYDRSTNLNHWRYSIEKGQRQSVSPRPPAGFSGHILNTRQPLLITYDLDKRAAELGSAVVAGEAPKSYLGVPLIAGGEATGVISLQNIDREQAFNENDLRLLSTLALNMGVALENARLFEETRRRAEEMAALAEIGNDIAATHDIGPVLERIVQRAGDLLQVSDIALYLLQPDGQTLAAEVAFGETVAEIKATSIQLGEGITGSVALAGTAEIFNYPEQDPRVMHIPGTSEESDLSEAIMLAPLLSRGQLVGVFSIWRQRAIGLFTQAELDLLVSLARQAAIAIESARLYIETERRATEMAALAEVGREISATLEFEAVLERIAVKALDLLDAGTSAVYLLQPDGNTLKAIAAQGEVAQEVLADEVQLGNGIIGSIVQNGVAERIDDTIKDPRGVHIPGTEATPAGEKLLVAPLLVQERAIGALAAWRDPQDPPFDPAELNFSIGLAQQAAVAIENARLFEAAQETRRRMADIIDFLPDAMLVIDRQGRVITWNHAIEALTGVKAAEILGKVDYEYALPFYGERRPILIDLVLLGDEEIETKYAHLQRQGATLLGEAVVPVLQGKPAYLMAAASTLRNAKGEVVGAIEIIRDISDRKRAEQELQQAKAEAETARQQAEAANQAKSAFLAMMSHEIRTPMNAIIGMSGLLMDTTLNPEQREFAETIRSSSDALLTIINDILDFSKVEAGKMTLEEQPFDLRECIESSLDLMKVRAAEKGLELAYQMEPDVPPALLGDVTRLRQVLINLLGNAVKFTEHGEVVVNVACIQDAETRGHGDMETSFPESPHHPITVSPSHPVPVSLHFTVRDTGIGIPPDRLSQLFQPFTQADASTSRRYGGTGLGLALSKRLVVMMGGTMWAESEGVSGRGSTFHFTIAAQPAPDWQGRPQLQGEQPQLRGRRLLVVDDNATNRRILTLQTQAWGMHVRAAVTPGEALEWLRRGDPFDLAILDLQMPDMDGVELAGAIRKLEAERVAPRLPLVLISSLGGRETSRGSPEFTAVLSKPLRQSTLFDILMNVFASQPQPEEGPHRTPQPLTGRVALDPGLAARHPLRILLAEDNAVNQKLALRLLSQMGYRADVAANGLEAIQAVERQQYDVILMDVQMPEMDGLEATRQICARWPRENRPHIIAMTANAMQGDREMCLQAGMDDYLSKPIRVEELVNALNGAQTLAGNNNTRG